MADQHRFRFSCSWLERRRTSTSSDDTSLFVFGFVQEYATLDEAEDQRRWHAANPTAWAPHAAIEPDVSPVTRVLARSRS